VDDAEKRDVRVNIVTAIRMVFLCWRFAGHTTGD